MRIVLVHMPWGPIGLPSLALGILRTAARRAGHRVTVRNANLDFVDWVTAKRDFGLADYEFYSESSYFQGAGDWIFSGALYADAPDGARTDRFARLLVGNGATTEQVETTLALHELTPLFVADLADAIAALRPDVVGFTTTFQQNTAGLAAARMVKERLPGTVTVFGGANCDGPQGAALHRNFPFLDYVVRGEGELAFPALMSTVEGDGSPSAVPGLCWRDEGGASVANSMAARPLPPGDIVLPDYDGFYERLETSVAARWVEPRLVVEGSRGCWWGEKHHCTFCGLNGSFMEFRSKSPERFLRELLDLARRHQLLDFFVVDNILDMSYFEPVLGKLADGPYDLRLHFEIKSNLRRPQFQALGDSGAVLVQPGIESLSSRVLKLMDKGVTGCQNVRALRDAESTGVSPEWNYLYGFPGETDADYTAVLDQLPMLHHLAPPVSAGRLAVERFSPYFDRPELGFADARPAPQYADTYRLPEAELHDLAYIFTATPRGIGEELAGRLAEAVDGWQAAYPGSRLTWQQLDGGVLLVSRRPAYDWTVLRLASEPELALFTLLDQPRSLSTMEETVGAAVARGLLERWRELGIVFTDGDRYLHVATEADNQLLLRVNRTGGTDQAQTDQAQTDQDQTDQDQEEGDRVSASA
jgi:ribosomal peptide maturation radical SAM protein 1